MMQSGTAGLCQNRNMQRGIALTALAKLSAAQLGSRLSACSYLCKDLALQRVASPLFIRVTLVSNVAVTVWR
jgi:hypothetical protein